MSIFTSAKSFRYWSWVLGAASIAPIVYYAYQDWQFSQWTKQQTGNGAFICGTGIVTLFMLCAVAAAVFSVGAMLLGLVGYLKLGKPRPKIRLLEVALLGCSLLIAGAAAFGIL